VVLLVRLARGTGRARRPAPAVAGLAAPADAAGAGDWLARARALERAGEWREALRWRYRALVHHLVASGVLDEVPGRTSGEHRILVAAAVPRAAGDFDAASRLFELAWFGRRPTGPAEASRFAELSERVVRAAS
jgi:hypothetical protein